MTSSEAALGEGSGQAVRPGSGGCGREKEEWRKGPVADLGALVLRVRDHRRSKGSLLATHLQGWGCAEGGVQEEPGFVAWNQRDLCERPGVT